MHRCSLFDCIRLKWQTLQLIQKFVYIKSELTYFSLKQYRFQQRFSLFSSVFILKEICCYSCNLLKIFVTFSTYNSMATLRQLFSDLLLKATSRIIMSTNKWLHCLSLQLNRHLKTAIQMNWDRPPHIWCHGYLEPSLNGWCWLAIFFSFSFHVLFISSLNFKFYTCIMWNSWDTHLDTKHFKISPFLSFV